MPDQAFTANEAAAISRVPLKQVHRIIDAGLLSGAVEIVQGSRRIATPGLLALKVAHVTAALLTPEARRRVVVHALEQLAAPVIREQAVTVEVDGIGAELREGLADLQAAKDMVTTDPDVMAGAPCFAGTRLCVHDIADMVANGSTVAALAEAYPGLDEGRIRLAPVYAAAYPRRGRPKRPVWKKTEPKSAKTLRLDDAPDRREAPHRRVPQS